MSTTAIKIPVCATPNDIYNYWIDYRRCRLCLSEIRHEMHLNNHYRKYHWPSRMQIRYFAWFKEFQRWVEITRNSYVYFKASRSMRRPVAMALGRSF